ncbi:MAG: hypothetical protein HFG93_10880 [Dorea sp.]|nr:hypothetical protein [Dorea sp.]
MKKDGKNGIEFSMIGNKVYEKYEDFKNSDHGDSQFNQYVKVLNRLNWNRTEQSGK